MSVSPTDVDSLDTILKGDPAGVYAAMDASTRARYRTACEELALGSGLTAAQVARQVVRWSAEREVMDARDRHVGEPLIGATRSAFERLLGCRVSASTRLVRWSRRHAARLYVGSLFAATLALLLGVERFLAARELDLTHRLLLVALLMLPVLELVQEVVDTLLQLRFEDSPVLPKLEPERVFGPETRTLVVTPLLVADVEDIDDQLRKLEVCYLGNVSPEVFFALLTDFPDAAEKELPGEGEVLRQLEHGIQALNARHGYRERPRFLWLHRERRWNPVARRWMGWERKRGKLEELNQLILGANDTSYTGDIPEVVRTVRYVITLDADNRLIPGSAARLVAALHHPLNQARFDATGQRVVSGYSMIQPALMSEPTKQAWLETGGWPVSLVRDTGRNRMSMRQGVFGVGEFLGKGIYNVASFSRSLDGRIPENAILSHDKLEGMFSRVASTPDVKLFEGRPSDLVGSARAWHRWIRGDWQLLPWLLPWVPSRGGRWVANSLGLIDRWKLLADLRSSLSFPTALLAVTYGWLWSPGGSSASAWTLGATLWLCRHPLCHGVANTLFLAWRYPSLVGGLRFMVSTVRYVLSGVVMNLALLLPFTGIVMDAVIRALYRLGVDRSRILDWTTNSHANRKVRALSPLMLPEVRRTALLALLIAGSLVGKNPGALPWASPMLVAWIPLVAFARKSRHGPSREEGDMQGLGELARRCWTLYAQAAEDLEGPARDEVAELTPTDVSLGLLAPLCAHHLGSLPASALVSMLDEAISALAALERYRGHLFARYDSRSRRPLDPRRVSTAESGTLAAALVTLESGLRGLRGALQKDGAATEAMLATRIEALETRARTLREQMDFTLLHDASSDLLHVGFDVETQALDAALHGRLASAGLLASFVSVAERQVPLRHWTALLTADAKAQAPGADLGRDAAAERLLPSLFLWFPPATLLGNAASTALDVALERGAPAWLLALALRFMPGITRESLQRSLEAKPAMPRQSLGMVLMALTNLACDDILIQHFHQHWQTAWVDALVYETKGTP